jgi:poly-gamma-glutamate synthesis protein (capsule biosynthesis protein)
MIFCGDIAQPYSGASNYTIPEELKSKPWLGNLEGSLIDERCKKEDVRGVYNDLAAIKELQKQIPFKAFNIANNHLLDAADVQTTLGGAKELGTRVVGAGCDLKDAQQSLENIDNDGETYRILAFGWENIQCVPAQSKKQGVNPYTRENVLHCVSEALKENEPVICFMHWDYELEKYPQPYDRQLAFDIIDMGVEAVIGCHAHRVQPIEFYKGKPIVYGLGNFLFCQGYYFGGNLSFPKFCEKEYAFEITKEGFKLHYFHYDHQENRLEYVKSAKIGSDKEFEGKAEFSGYSDKEYEYFFKKNRVQKKMLPVFHTKEPAVSYWTKSEWIKLRGWMLDTAMKLNIKSAKRAER